MSEPAASEQVPGVLIWFEATAGGRAALDQAYAVAERQQSPLTVITVATRERVVGCGRCLQGTVLWNIEMKKIAYEELLEAQRILDGAAEVAYEVVVGDPAEAITAAAARTSAGTIVLPPDRGGRFVPRNRRNVSRKVTQALGLAHSHTASPSPSVATAQRAT